MTLKQKINFKRLFTNIFYNLTVWNDNFLVRNKYYFIFYYKELDILLKFSNDKKCMLHY